jgi:uracil-DNA glycosylase family 4
MKGFFLNAETQSNDLKQAKQKFSCYSCGLYKGEIKYPKMQPTGGFAKGILNIGEFTNAQDDAAGKPFQGKEKLIYEVYKELGIDLEEDCLNVNAVMCHSYDKKSGKVRVPSEHEISCCRINIIRVIEQYKPSVIVLFGKIALNSVMTNLWSDSINSVDTWRGFIIPDQKYKCWITTVFSPSYVRSTMEKNPVVLNVWKQDLRDMLNVLKYERFPVYKEPKISIIKDLSVLSTIPNHSTIAFDYETTGLKPHAEGHRIVCASVATSEDEVYVFEMPKSKQKREPFIELLKNPYIQKMAHNIKFEDSWTIVRLKTRIKNWYWCSMQAAHVLDNRTGITGLKFQTYINFGVSGYNDVVKPHLQSEDAKNANSLNKMVEYIATPVGKRETLHYCALDSIFEYRLAMKQMKTIEDRALPF